MLKHWIHIKTEHWDVRTPGYLEIDLVSQEYAEENEDTGEGFTSFIQMNTCPNNGENLISHLKRNHFSLHY